MRAAECFINELQLEQLDTLLFRGNPNDWPNRHVFGGHVVAQAMEAANATVDENFWVNSLHCYFLRPGIAGQPIIYDVDPIRNGRSFVTRRVVAKQNGEAIFNIAISYHVGEPGFSHQIDMVSGVPNPEELEDDQAYYERLLEAYQLEQSPAFYMPFEMRSIDKIDPTNPQPKDPVTGGYWFRFREKIDDDKELHRRLLAYISDFAFVTSSLRPHGVTFADKRLKTVASLDHTMWFHSTDVRVDEWIYYQTEGYWSGNGRGLARGSLYAHNGALLASTSQECLLRLHPEAQTS